MKKIVLLSAFVLAFASCSAPVAEETSAVTDSTTVVVDTTCAVTCDSTKVEVCK